MDAETSAALDAEINARLSVIEECLASELPPVGKWVVVEAVVRGSHQPAEARRWFEAIKAADKAAGEAR